MPDTLPALLVSVRSGSEAQAAMDGGAALIDIKEPARGSLGRPDQTTIDEVLAAVDGRVPVSAALGEWADEPHPISDVRLAYVKWGLAGCRRRPVWRRELSHVLRTRRFPQLVLAAYADWECADAPPLQDVYALAADHPGSVLLVDTHCKTALPGKPRPTLLDWLPIGWIEDLCARCHEAGVRIALAGSLGFHEIALLSRVGAHWLAVRGGVCDESDRHGTVRAAKVRQLVELLNSGLTVMNAG